MVEKCRIGGACLLLLVFATVARVDTQTVQTSFDAAPPLAAVSIRPTTATGPMVTEVTEITVSQEERRKQRTNGVS